MRSRIAILAALLVLGTAIVATAQIAVEPSTGTIVRIDPQSSVVMLDDGRMYRVTPSTVFLVDNRPAAFTALRPGERVMIQSAEPVIYREGRYVTVQAAPSPPVVTQAPPATVVVPQPPAAAVPAGVRSRRDARRRPTGRGAPLPKRSRPCRPAGPASPPSAARRLAARRRRRRLSRLRRRTSAPGSARTGRS